VRVLIGYVQFKKISYISLGIVKCNTFYRKTRFDLYVKRGHSRNAGMLVIHRGHKQVMTGFVCVVPCILVLLCMIRSFIGW
jgi:hypothetical protein